MSEPDLRQGVGGVAEPPSTNERVTRTIALVQGAARRANVACTLLSEARSPDRREILIDSAQVRDIVIIDVRGGEALRPAFLSLAVLESQRRAMTEY